MIIITGASKGIGEFLFRKLQNSGERVLGTYCTTQPKEELQDFFSKVDITSSENILSWIEEIKDNLSNITLINCAGSNYNSFAHKSNVDEWVKVIDVNLIGTYKVIREILPIMREEGYGRIINFSSVVGQTGIPGTSAYAASKTGLWGLTRAIAVENAKKGITINNLNLGYFDIGMISEVSSQFRDVIKSKIPSGKFGNPENIYKVVQLLREADDINGTSVDINSGLY
jgi:acetoacetyl-CoA reductase/3-oxoacyl-[acyl-carrier protein] reductase